MGTLAQQLVNGVVIGAVYGLIALGYTMVYGIVRLINFAQGGLYAAGAFIGLEVVEILQAHRVESPALLILAALAGAMIATGALAFLVERVAYRPLRRAPILSALVSSLAVLFLIENVIQLLTGAQPQTYPSLLGLQPWTLGPITLAPSGLLIVLVALGLMGAMQWFVQRTRTGRAMRAIAVNQEVAGLMGVDVRRVVALTFVMGGALGAAAGVLVGLNYGTITFNMGELAGLEGFTAAVLGGIGNVPGALVGGLVLGLLQSLITIVLPNQWNEAVVFAVLIAVLAFRPRGILGERVAERA